MTVLSDSGALAGANLAVNILIAIGTIGAAGVALWLGIRAQRAGGAQAREARMKQTRQIVSVYNPPEAGIASSIEVVNASPEVVTRLLVEVHASIGVDDARQDLLWEWTDDALTSRWPTVSYLLAGQSAKLLARSR